jgi:hypothetical protein
LVVFLQTGQASGERFFIGEVVDQLFGRRRAVRDFDDGDTHSLLALLIVAHERRLLGAATYRTAQHDGGLALVFVENPETGAVDDVLRVRFLTAPKAGLDQVSIPS